MSKLPPGWAWSEIGQIADCQLGKMLDAAKNKGELRPYLRNINVRWFDFNLNDLKQMRVTDAEGEQFGIRDGDVLICEGGVPGRAAVWRGGKTALTIQKALHRARPNGAYESNLLASFLKHSVAENQIDAYLTGSTIKHLPQSALRSVKLPVPPLPEQRRIVAKVDGLTARTARARKELDRIPTLIARYKQRLLALAFSGELTAEWRKVSDTPTAEFLPVSKLCKTITDGDHQAPPRAEDGIPFITISAMNDGKIDLNKATRYVPESYFDGLKDSRRAEVGDVLFSVTGSIGIPALVQNDAPFVFQRHIAILKPDARQTSGAFLRFMLESPDVKAQCLAIATGTAQLTVPLSGLRNFIVPLPVKEEQAEIVRRIESAFGWLDRMAADHAAAARLLPKLDAAILAKAFRGELVPQDPNDEPASVLLERIRVEREATPKKGRGRPRVHRLEAIGITSGRPEIGHPTLGVVRKTKKAASMTKSRKDDDVLGQPYLAKLVRDMGGAVAPNELYSAANLELVDFYQQLSLEHDAGWLEDDNTMVKAA